MHATPHRVTRNVRAGISRKLTSGVFIGSPDLRYGRSPYEYLNQGPVTQSESGVRRRGADKHCGVSILYRNSYPSLKQRTCLFAVSTFVTWTAQDCEPTSMRSRMETGTVIDGSAADRNSILAICLKQVLRALALSFEPSKQGCWLPWARTARSGVSRSGTLIQ